MSELSDNWRSIDVKRERTHQALEAQLVSGGRDSMFSLLKDLMVFAASVGHAKEVRTPLNGETNGITLDTYHTDGKDGYIYLFGLLEFQDGECLKIENLRSTIKVYEEFCNTGLYEIQSWLDSNPSDPAGTDTILRKMLEKITSIQEEDGVKPGDIEIEI
jgi:dnd system-associated protein 4